MRDAAAVQGVGNAMRISDFFFVQPAGAQKFGEWTGKNIGNYMGVVLDDQVKSAAYINRKFSIMDK